jgi:hypothetical protein
MLKSTKGLGWKRIIYWIFLVQLVLGEESYYNVPFLHNGSAS